jgi:hypothetical protein
MRVFTSLALLATTGLAAAAEPSPTADTTPRRYELSARASKIDPLAKEYPELSFVFGTENKPDDLEHACVDTRVAPAGKLVIWLMGPNKELFDRVTGFGMHAIQVHYARGWFAKFYSGPPPQDDLLLSKIRLEAATGEDCSDLVTIAKPDCIMQRAYQLVKWLAVENPQGNWPQFLTADGKDLIWEKVILAGISHGATTAARMAKQVRVDRVVMFSGPRDQYEVWQQLPSATPAERFFGFTHVLDDGWQNDHYSRSWLMMRLNDYGPIVDVDQTRFPYGNSRRLITAADVGGKAERAHSSVAPGTAAIKVDGKFIHEDVWRYLFTHPVNSTGAPVAAEPDCRINQRPH